MRSVYSDCKLKEPAPEGKDDLAALRLWEISAKLVGYDEENWHHSTKLCS